MASEIKLSHLAIHLISRSAVIEEARAAEKPEVFIHDLIRAYNARKKSEKKADNYDYKPVQQLQWDRNAHGGMRLQVYYSRRPHKGDSAEFLSALSTKDYKEEFTTYQLHFAYFLYFVVSGAKQQEELLKSKEVWALFVLTTNNAYRLVRPYCDYRFPTRIAFRIMDPMFHRKEIKPLVGNKEGDVSTYKTPYNLKLNAYRSLWILYKNFDATVKPGSSLHRALDLPAEQKMQLHIGEGMIRLGGGHTLDEYQKILPLLFNMKRNWTTTKLDGTDEEDDSAFQTFANIRRVNMSEQARLDSQLIQLVWKAVTTSDPIPSLHLSHWHYHQYYGSTSFKLSIQSKNIGGSHEWTYPPTFKELVDQLKHHQLDTLDFEKFAITIPSIFLECSEMGSKYPLIQYIQGEVAYEGNIYYRMEGVWLKIANQHLATTERLFLNILDTCLATKKNKKGHLLPLTWISKEDWVHFSFLDYPQGISLDIYDTATSPLKDKKISVIDANGIVQLAYPVRALFQGESTSTIKKLKKRWEELKSWLQKYLLKEVKPDTLTEVFPKTSDQFFKLLQKSFAVYESQRSCTTRVTPIGEGGKVLFADLTQVLLPKDTPKYLSSNVTTITKFLSSRDSVNEGDLREISEIPKRYRQFAYKHLQNKYTLSEKISGRYLMQGPVPGDIKMDQALKEFLDKRHEEYKLVIDEEQYSRLYLNEPDYLVFDQIFPGMREQVELFDLLYMGEKGKLYLYAIKEGFNNSTGIACTQIRVAMKNIQVDRMTEGNPLLRTLYQKGVETKATSDFRTQLQNRLKKMTCDEFVSLFVDREIIFVYAFLDTNDKNRLLENELGLLQPVTKNELEQAKIKDAQTILNTLKKEEYIDDTAKLTDKFLRKTQTDFEKEIQAPGLYELLMRRVSLYDSMIAKLEIIKLFDDFQGTNFTFQIHQLDRPGKVAEKFNYSTLGEVPQTTHLFQGKVTCGKTTYSFNRIPKTLEELFSQLLGQKDPYSAYLVLGGLKKDKDFPLPNQEVTEEVLAEAAKLLGKTLAFVDESYPPAILAKSDIVIVKNDKDYYVSREAPIPDYDSREILQQELALYEPKDIYDSVGLDNLHSDCFLNATLQLLFRTGFHKILFERPDETNDLSWALKAFSLRYETANTPLQTNHLRNFMSVSLEDQEDPAQALGDIFGAFKLDELDDAVAVFNVEQKPSQIPGTRLDGIPNKLSTLEELAKKRQSYPIIGLPIPQENATFEECWKAFVQSENGDTIKYRQGDAAYESQGFTQTFALRNIPTFLCIQFLRFTKENIKIAHPLTLQQTLQIKGIQYEIVAAIIHEGNTCTSGHYTSVVKTGNSWEHINDTVINEVKIEHILPYLNQAYILLLKKKT